MRSLFVKLLVLLLCMLDNIGSVVAIRIKQQIRKTRSTYSSRPRGLFGDTAAYADIVLAYMHSFVAIPVSRKLYSSLFTFEPQSNSPQHLQEASTQKIKTALESSSNFESTVSDADTRASYYAAVHWNTPESQEALFVEPLTFNVTSTPHVHIKWRLPMHPKCAWGVMNVLRRPYNSGRRQGFGKNFVGAALNALNGGAGNNSGFMLAIAGYTNKSDDFLFERIANKVDWPRIMHCGGVSPRSYARVMSSETKGAVCWNFVIDIRDMMCSAWRANAWMRQCKLTDGACCDRLKADFDSYKNDRGSWVYRLRDLTTTLGNTLKDVLHTRDVHAMSQDEKSYRMRQIETLMTEMAASRIAGGISLSDVGLCLNEGLKKSGWIDVMKDFVAEDDEDDALADRASPGLGWIFGFSNESTQAKPPPTMTPIRSLYTACEIIDARFKRYASNFIKPHLNMLLSSQ